MRNGEAYSINASVQNFRLLMIALRIRDRDDSVNAVVTRTISYSGRFKLFLNDPCG